MPQNDLVFVENCDSNRIDIDSTHVHQQHHKPPDQQVPHELRPLSVAEANIVRIINNCLRNWYEPWKRTYLNDGREFKIVYDLMEGLLHYEYQITSSETALPDERRNAIARAVARLVDYGNAILNMDLIIRASDETSSEIDPNSVTTVGLFKAHLKANTLREKLLYDYFKKDKPGGSKDGCGDDYTTSPTTNRPPTPASSVVLQVSTQSSQILNLSPRMERLSLGSNSSININSEERKASQNSSSSLPQSELKTSNDLDGQIEITHMLATIRSTAFSSSQSSATRLVFLPGILSKIENLLTVPTSLEKLSNCFDIMDALFESIERLPQECRSQEVTMISNSLLKPIVRKVYIDDRDSLIEFQHAYWTTYLISIMRIMTPTDFSTYLRHFSNLADLSAFLKDYLFIIRRLISTCDKSTSPFQLELDHNNSIRPTYPVYWIEMTLLACSTFLTSLTFLYQILKQLFPTNLQMWTGFIECLVHFLLQEALKPDRIMLKERQRLLAEDLRQTTAEYVWIAWDSFSPNQKQSLLEDLLDPLIQASMVLKSKQRAILLPIFYDMMRCDYTSQYILPRGSVSSSTSSTLTSRRGSSGGFQATNLSQKAPSSSSYIPNTNESLPYLSFQEAFSEDGTVLTRFTHSIIGTLNTLMIDYGLGDESFKNELCLALSGLLDPKYYNRNAQNNIGDTSHFKSMAKHTADLIAEFMQICLDSHQANELSYKHLYLLCLFKLVLFFKDKVDRAELYLTYLYKLCCIHQDTGRYVEAGFTLLEHAKSLPWSEKPLDNQYRILTRYFQTPQPLSDYTSLKTALYGTIIEFFDKGQLWEPAIPLCRELVDVYEFKTFEYSKLAQILAKMSLYFNNIAGESEMRSNPEYFRVTFYGGGFPASIRSTTMIYRGKPFEKLGDFQVTILSKYPDAKLLNSLAKPDDTVLNDPEAKYLQVNACSPVVDLRTKFGENLTKISEPILNFYRNNECDKFQFSRRINRPLINSRERSSTLHQKTDDTFANMWRERTTLTTNTLPGMLPFFPVFLIELSVVSPIESAIEDLERTNDRLWCMVNRFKSDKRQVEDVRLLSQLLLGVVDAAVNGGVAKYEDAFFTNPTITNRASPSSTSETLQSTSEAFNMLSFNEASQRTAYNLDTAQEQRQLDYVDTPSAAQVDKLKCLIAKQVPILDEAIRLHRDRVADIMRPQHDHLEASYKKMRHHIMTKYSRYLPSEYSRSSTRSYRSLARSPNRSIRSDSRFTMSSGESHLRTGSENRVLDISNTTNKLHTNVTNSATSMQSTSKIPYKQLDNERRPLPFLTNDPAADRVVIQDMYAERARQPSDPIHQPIQILPNNVSSSDNTDSQLIYARPIPATRTSLSRGSANFGDGEHVLYANDPAFISPTKSQYTRLLHDNDDSDPEFESSEQSMRKHQPKNNRNSLTSEAELVSI